MDERQIFHSRPPFVYEFPEDSWIVIPPSSQRESWFVTSHYIAEFWCCLSNIGFFLVCAQYQFHPKTWLILMAGYCSVLSHTFALRPFLWIDKFAMISVYFIYFHHWPWLLVLLPFHLFDTFLHKTIFCKYLSQTFTHVVWHLVATAVAYQVLRVEITSEEIQKIGCLSPDMIPGHFLCRK
jgi:hypothetical protein